MLLTARTVSAHWTEFTWFSFRLRSSSSRRHSSADEIWDTWGGNREGEENLTTPVHLSKTKEPVGPLWRRRRQQWGWEARACYSAAEPYWWCGWRALCSWRGGSSAPWQPAASQRVHTAEDGSPWERNAPLPGPDAPGAPPDATQQKMFT